METIDDVMGYVTNHANMDIEHNRARTGKDYTPAVGWLLERIAMKSTDTGYGELQFPQNIMFTEIPNLRKMITELGKGGDSVDFHETMKSAVAVHSYLQNHSYDGIELGRSGDRT